MRKDALMPQARHHFTRFDQVDQLVSARESDADLCFMAWMMALCSLGERENCWVGDVKRDAVRL